MKRVRKLNDFKQHSIVMAEPGLGMRWRRRTGQFEICVRARELHGDGLDFMMDTMVIAGMGTAFMIVPQ